MREAAKRPRRERSAEEAERALDDAIEDRFLRAIRLRARGQSRAAPIIHLRRRGASGPSGEGETRFPLNHRDLQCTS
jgi:hypothetical protein